MATEMGSKGQFTGLQEDEALEIWVVGHKDS